MKRLLTSAVAAAVMVAGLGSGAHAQGMGASLFDLSLYGGVGYHYNWLQGLRAVGGTDDRLHPGFAPVLGAAATFWASPMLGIRTNVTFSDIDLPEGARPEVVNGWLYDLNLVLRPWFASTTAPRLMTSFYAFLGGGAFTANPPGENACVAPYARTAGACLALDWEKSTVGQGTVGLGWDVVSLTDRIGLFTELAANFYDSPFHTGPAWTGTTVAGADERDTFGTTGRLVAGLKFSFGEAAPAVVPVPTPAPTPPPPPPPAPAAPATREITVCVVDANGLRNVTATFNPTTGDTMVAGQRFAMAHPANTPTYAAGATWFINTDNIRVNDREFVKFGVSRLINEPTQLTRVGEFQGTPVFAEAGTTAPHSVLYVPLRPGCEFQPYQARTAIRPRG